MHTRLTADTDLVGTMTAAEPPSRRAAEPPSRRAAEPPSRRAAEPPFLRLRGGAA